MTPQPQITVAKSVVSAERAHAITVRMHIDEIARFLQDNLGQRLTARLAGISDPKQVGRWASGDSVPRHDAEERLRAALQVFQLIQDAESLYTARAWMIGMNPQLEDQAPAQCIADGRLRDVMVAARAYVDGG
ncbi:MULTISPECIES: XRE family transcriptional regulator [unclassified Streptomyces]|uniref:XRE family transcriptional regulator n=1 Tax=unclassified Streptomyces TaxID=2593676 RepID=UPI002270E0F2|nr:MULTISPECIES: XRE family transcriptional regulator [unclassified Streptomyces]MCY0922468.1 XRE family transcriptional regulator [Streptomyces sp. H27-G5]MCY0960530.1 XRE family transcriptional regulator [Streptomyces sp. H27-H5]